MTPGWDESVYVVHDRARTRAVGAERTLLLGYDKDRVLDAELCNKSRPSGEVCRMPKGHDGLHVPISGELIAVTGVYVLGVAPNQMLDRV